MAEDFAPDIIHNENFVPGETQLRGSELYGVVCGVFKILEHKGNKAGIIESRKLLRETLGESTEGIALYDETINHVAGIAQFYGRTGRPPQVVNDLVEGLSHNHKKFAFSAYADGKREAAD